MKTLKAFQMRYQRQILDVCNAEVLQRSGFSTIGGILRLCLAMLHAWTLEYGIDVLRLTVDTYESRKAMASCRRPLFALAGTL